jgi:hypothetical protein
MEGKKLLLACGVITLAAILIITAVIFAMSRTAAPGETRPSPLTVTGTLTCLKHKNTVPGQPQTLECAIGLHAQDGRDYSLQNLTPEQSSASFETTLTIQGDLYPPAADDRYDTVGSIRVTKFSTN